MGPALAPGPDAGRYSGLVVVVGSRSPSARCRGWLRSGEVLLVAGLSLACGSDEPHTGAAASAPLPIDQSGVPAAELPYTPCAAEDAVGQFVIELASDYTRVGGQIFDGVLPTRVPRELGREQECRLVEVVPTSCSPACPVATEICDRNQSCVPLPVARDVGTVNVTGLALPLAMKANAVTHSYTNPAQPPLPHPGFAPGADLRVGSSGGDYAPFVLRGWGVSGLTLAPEPIAVSAGAPVALAWSPPSSAGPARLHVTLNINHHGSSNAWIECDFPDTGTAQIPAALVDGLMAKGRSGFPTLTASRRSATSVEIEPGCIDLLVVSEVPSGVDVDGIISCNTSAECPDGQSCLPVERFCQ